MVKSFEEAYRFSPFTGNGLAVQNGVLTDKVTEDKHFLNPKPAVNVAIGDGTGKILLVKRAGDPHKGTWDIPGGFMEIGETLEGCAQRETLEELGVKVTQLVYLGSWIESYEFQGILLPLVVVNFSGTIESDVDIVAKDDVSEWRWFRQEDVLWNEMAWVSIQETVRKFFNS